MNSVAHSSQQPQYNLKSSDHVDGHERRLENEIEQLCLDIRRIGPTYPHPEPRVLFGELFDDEQVEQYYEALVGTLKSAKKRGLISFKGQMLLKGAHDRVVVTLLEGAPEEGEQKCNKNPTIKTPEGKADQVTRASTSPTAFSGSNKISPIPKPSSVTEHKPTPLTTPTNTSNARSPPSISDDVSVTSYSSTYNHSGDVVTQATRRKGSLPYKKSAHTSSYTPSHTTRPSVPAKIYNPMKKYVPAKRQTSNVVRASSCPSYSARTEMRDRLAEEIPQLLADIRRIGIPGEPSVLFGQLFDDELVEQYYEALVGTLKSAKKKGYISFKGQMLLKGMHDNVLINICKES